MDNKASSERTGRTGTPPPRIIELARNQKLVIERSRPRSSTPEERVDHAQDEDRVRLLDADGTTNLTIRVGAGGTVIELGGGPVALNVEGDLAISSRRLLLHGREEVAITSEENVTVEARENASLRAKRQEIVSTRGNLKASANDDVIINGERIRMNC